MNVRLRALTGKYLAGAAEVDWAAVYAEQLPRVYNYFRFKVGHGPLAEDLTAQTFERAWRGRARYRHDLGAFSTWLFTIARNVAISYFRRRGQGQDLPLGDFVAQANAATLEEASQRRSDLARLRRLLAVLPERERELIELKYGADLTNRAIAKLTGLSESNVGTIPANALVASPTSDRLSLWLTPATAWLIAIRRLAAWMAFGWSRSGRAQQWRSM